MAGTVNLRRVTHQTIFDAIQVIVIAKPHAKRLWKDVAEPLLDERLAEPIFRVDHRVRKGTWRDRAQPDPNHGKFRSGDGGDWITYA